MYFVAVLFGNAAGRQQQNVGGDAHIAPPCCYRTGCPKGRDIENGREAEGGLPYDMLIGTFCGRPGG